MGETRLFPDQNSEFSGTHEYKTPAYNPRHQPLEFLF